MKLNAKGRIILKTLGNVVASICVLVILWGLISFIDVNVHNGFGGTGPSSWNLFKLLVDWSNI